MGENLQKVRPVKVSIMLDKKRHLLYDMNAFAELEEIFGTIEEALTELGKGKIKALRAILWAGLIHEDEALTEKQVGTIIGFGDLADIALALNKSIASALPASEDVPSNPNA